MAAEYRWIMTADGIDKKAAAEAGGPQVTPSVLVVGDGGGAYHEPEELVNGLIHEVWRGPVNRIYVHPTDLGLVVIEAVIPADVGGWDIREAAIEDSQGTRILVGKYPLTTKPAPDSGATKEIVVRGGMRISNGGDTVMQIAGDLVFATKDYVDQHVLDIAPHQATSAPTPERLLIRDGAGRAQVAAPQNPADIAVKATVDAHANADAPHAGHVSHSLATALNDFLVASKAGLFVKRSLDEVKAIFGFGSAAYKNVGTAANQVAAGNTLQLVYAVGTLYFNASDSRNPNLLLGFGTWVACGAGRMLLGAGGGYAAGQTGGETSHVLTVGEMPSHDHLIDFTGHTSGGTDGGGRIGSGANNAEGIDNFNTQKSGGGQAHNNMPPYLVVYIWQRTA